MTAVGERIDTLLDALAGSGTLVHERAEELVRQVTTLYGAGIERILTILDARQALDDATLAALTSDELVSGLLLVHGLHPDSVETRVQAALERVRPYLHGHHGDVEFVGVTDESVVRLRLLGSCDGCPGSTGTLRGIVEEAIESAAPDVAAVQIEEQPAERSAPLIPIDALRIRLAGAELSSR